MENQDKPVRKPRKAAKPVVSDMPEIGEPQPVEVDKSDIAVQTAAEPTLADKIRMMHEAAKIAENGAKALLPREGDIVAMLDKEGNVVQTYTVRRRGTTMTEDGGNRTYAVPQANLTKVAEKVWSYPMPTFEGKVYQYGDKPPYQPES